MEEKIKNIINSLDNFVIVDIVNQDIDDLEPKDNFVQLKINKNSMEDDLRNFDNRINVLVSYDDKQINIYARITDNYKETDMQNLINVIAKEFPIENRLSNKPSLFRFDTLNIKKD